LLHKDCELWRFHQFQIEEGQAVHEFFGGLGVGRKVGTDQHHTVHVVGLDDIGDKTAVEDQPLDTRAFGQLDQPPEGLELDPAQLRLASEAGLDLIERRPVDPGGKYPLSSKAGIIWAHLVLAVGCGRSDRFTSSAY
jgi:hypothetical protein